MLAATRRLIAAGVVDLVALISLTPDVIGLLSRLPHVRHLFISNPDAAIVQIGAALLWCVALWLGIGLLATAACQGGGQRGRIARAVSGYLLPAVMRRMLAGAVGIGAVLSPVALAAPANAATAVADSAAAPVLPVPLWPVDIVRSAHDADTPLWPVSTTGAPTPPTARGSTSVTVQPGDSLWSIAQQQLGPRATPARTTAMWHHWFHANRHVIGDDPSLIHPGQVLHAPKETS